MVANGGDSAENVLVPPTGGGNDQIAIRARSLGSSGNGTVTVREILSTATRGALDSAPTDSLVRASGDTPSEPARISGGGGDSFSVTHDSILRIMLNGVARDVRFRGSRTEATADVALDPTVSVVLDDTNNTLQGQAR